MATPSAAERTYALQMQVLGNELQRVEAALRAMEDREQARIAAGELQTAAIKRLGDVVESDHADRRTRWYRQLWETFLKGSLQLQAILITPVIVALLLAYSVYTNQDAATVATTIANTVWCRKEPPHVP
jgi:hypothetical protein